MNHCVCTWKNVGLWQVESYSAKEFVIKLPSMRIKLCSVTQYLENFSLINAETYLSLVQVCKDRKLLANIVRMHLI